MRPLGKQRGLKPGSKITAEPYINRKALILLALGMESKEKGSCPAAIELGAPMYPNFPSGFLMVFINPAGAVS